MPGATHRKRASLSEDELRNLPPAINLATANRILLLSRSKGYELARRGLYPCKVLRIGRSYRVITADLRRVLEIS